VEASRRAARSAGACPRPPSGTATAFPHGTRSPAPPHAPTTPRNQQLIPAGHPLCLFAVLAREKPRHLHRESTRGDSHRVLLFSFLPLFDFVFFNVS
jgi:hypothetical protein